MKPSVSERLIAMAQEFALLRRDDADTGVLQDCPEVYVLQQALTSLVGHAVLHERPAVDLSDVPVYTAERGGIITGKVDPQKPETWDVVINEDGAYVPVKQ